MCRLAKPIAEGRRGKERAASLRAQQRLAAGGRRPPDPHKSEAYTFAGSRTQTLFEEAFFT
jgi:hypothetical protein